MATDPAPLFLQNVTIATAPTIGTRNDSTTANTTGLGMTPQTSPQHDDGHIHHTLPLRAAAGMTT